MPRGDRIGPAGQGPMTGRRAGYCAGFDIPGYMNCGYGMGVGRGRGFAWRARATQVISPQPQVITEKQEKQILEQELVALKEEINEIEKRLKDI